ncbi:hypothetical protein BBF96_13110 [Anoxybacter fermentans]|uniref:Peptidase M50 domain-containing protein n=1 Tax=Anoxybacter fermentans TaxID=1323375 RepID=A0A3Q9HRZ2_9FIRM|nr:hypothetical protein [Anoxybacter fermentans]AZR74256.1 hypothetical protein BBF96_13110 [Anoxybacter fermentans]
MKITKDFVPKLVKNIEIYKNTKKNKLPYTIKVIIDNKKFIFRLSEEGMILLNLIDGNSTIEEITQKFNNIINYDLSVEEVGNYIFQMFYKNGLLTVGKKNYTKTKNILSKQLTIFICQKLIWLGNPKVQTYMLLIVINSFLYFAFFEFKFLDIFNISLTQFGYFLILYLLGIIFHELGHVTIAIYYGIKPNGIKLGIKKNMPFIFTEIPKTENYTNHIRSRIIIGGLYFQSIYLSILIWINFLLNTDVILLNIYYSFYVISIMLIPAARGDGYRFLREKTEFKKPKWITIYKFLTFILHKFFIIYGILVFGKFYIKIFSFHVKGYQNFLIKGFFIIYSLNFTRLIIREILKGNHG